MPPEIQISNIVENSFQAFVLSSTPIVLHDYVLRLNRVQEHQQFSSSRSPGVEDEGRSAKVI